MTSAGDTPAAEAKRSWAMPRRARVLFGKFCDLPAVAFVDALFRLVALRDSIDVGSQRVLRRTASSRVKSGVESEDRVENFRGARLRR